MKIVIFAGGSGTRFWPISRNNYPKQFQPIINNKSTIELLVDAVVSEYGWNNIFFATTELLVSLIKTTFPQVPTTNIITEPVQRDVGPAVGLAMQKLKKLGAGDEPVTILWSDSYAAKVENFKSVVKLAENKLLENSKQIVWLAQKPQFANDNLGWITLGEKKGEENGLSYYSLDGFKYRPELAQAEEWLKDGKHSWNTGYFMSTPNFVLEKYAQGNPGVAEKLEQIAAKMDTEAELATIQEVYPQIEAVHFDHIVLDHLAPEDTVIVEGDFDWNDPGTLYALKQFLQQNDDDNVCKGMVYNYQSRDSLVYNYVNNQLVTTVGLDGFLVVNTPDAVLVCHKKDIGKIKEMLKEFKDTELEKLL
jgi:mannose-1-phosphate guanylyltransferase